MKFIEIIKTNGNKVAINVDQIVNIEDTSSTGDSGTIIHTKDKGVFTISEPYSKFMSRLYDGGASLIC